MVVDAGDDRWRVADHAQARERSARHALAKPPRDHHHRHSRTNRRGWPAPFARNISGFLGTLFLFIAVSNLCVIIPGYEPPTGSLSTTTALALSVFVAVLLFGIEEQGLVGYLKSYLEPTFLMLPFNIISEISRTFALAIRLFGNIMSGTMIVGILLTITPLIFPDFMNLLGLLTGMVQAYIFSILATVYIAAATRTREE